MTPLPEPEPETQAQTLHLPRLLCLHGGGSNARIFKAQCRALRAELSHDFHFVFVDAPFPSEPGPDVTSVYQSSNFGQYRRWLRSGPHQPYIPPQEAVEAIEHALDDAKLQSDRQGATGDWVGIFGFSQGAKMAASVLLRQQVYRQRWGSACFAPSDFRFAVSIAGRAPLVKMDMDLLDDDPGLLDASQVPAEPQQPQAQKQHWQRIRSKAPKCLDENVLRLPTVHVHGLKDPGLHLHRDLLHNYCADEARLVEWNGRHRVPISTRDVRPVAAAIMDVARTTGILP
ncbi:MAG: hypothetical protein Q9169_005391 [Polycauliona sp. 2 TL-2023]